MINSSERQNNLLQTSKRQTETKPSLCHYTASAILSAVWTSIWTCHFKKDTEVLEGKWKEQYSSWLEKILATSSGRSIKIKSCTKMVNREQLLPATATFLYWQKSSEFSSKRIKPQKVGIPHNVYLCRGTVCHSTAASALPVLQAIH